MIAPFADSEDVAAYVGKAADALPEGTTLLLMLASGVITSEFPLVKSQDDVTEEVRTTCAQMVARVLRNPEGVLQHQIASFQEGFSAADLGGLLYVTDEERGWLKNWGSSSAGTMKTPSAYVEGS